MSTFINTLFLSPLFSGVEYTPSAVHYHVHSERPLPASFRSHGGCHKNRRVAVLSGVEATQKPFNIFSIKIIFLQDIQEMVTVSSKALQRPRQIGEPTNVTWDGITFTLNVSALHLVSGILTDGTKTQYFTYSRRSSKYFIVSWYVWFLIWKLRVKMGKREQVCTGRKNKTGV